MEAKYKLINGVFVCVENCPVKVDYCPDCDHTYDHCYCGGM